MFFLFFFGFPVADGYLIRSKKKREDEKQAKRYEQSVILGCCIEIESVVTQLPFSSLNLIVLCQNQTNKRTGLFFYEAILSIY